MPVAKKIKESLDNSSFIRKMFEEGIALKKKFGSHKVYDFSLGNPDLNPPDKFFKVMEHIEDNYQSGFHGYMPNAGYEHTRKKMALKASRDHGIDVNYENIVMTVGAAGALNIIFKTLLDPEDQVIVPTPYFVEYGAYVSNYDGKLILCDTKDDFSLDISAIEESITEKTKAVLINSPNNPTGKVYTEDEIKDLCGLLSKYREEKGQIIYLIADEPYREIIYDDMEVPGILCNYEYSMVATSFSKTLSIPGERIGYVALSPLCPESDVVMGGLVLANRILGFVNAPAIIQRVVAELVDESVGVDIYKKRRDIFLKGLDEAGIEYSYPEGAFYIFCKSPLEDDMEFVNYLKEYNILAVPGSGFGAKGYFRLCYCVEDSVIINSLPEFKRAMKNFN